MCNSLIYNKIPPLCDRRGYIYDICAELLTINGVFYVPLCSTKIANLGQTANFYQQNFLPPPSLLCSLSYIHHFHFRPLLVCLFDRSSVCPHVVCLFVCLFVCLSFVCLSACRRISLQSIRFAAAQCHPELVEGSPRSPFALQQRNVILSGAKDLLNDNTNYSLFITHY